MFQLGIKGVTALDVIRNLIYRIVANVIGRFVYDWLKSFFKDND